MNIEIIATSKPQIKRAVVEINGTCNYRCKMCPQTTPGREPEFSKVMSFSDFNHVLDELEGCGVEVVNLEGSGEPTAIRSLPKYIAEVTKRGMKAYIYTNGFLFKDDLMRECIDAGLSLVRFSVIGYNMDVYAEWMNRHWVDFTVVLNNAINAKAYIKETKADTIVASYHLITDNTQVDFEIARYKENFINKVGSQAEIWKQHNWASVYDAPERSGKKKTCGRPFAPDIVVRAGGNDGNSLSVAPCCQVLGSDVEASLGHLKTQTLEEVWWGDKYNELRMLHAEERFDEIPYCKNCDFLIDDPDTLVYTNSSLVDTQQMKGVSFSLDEYRGKNE